MSQFLGAFMPLDAKVRCIECAAEFLLDITKTYKQAQSVHGNYMHKQGILFIFLHKKQRTGTILRVSQSSVQFSAFMPFSYVASSNNGLILK